MDFWTFRERIFPLGCFSINQVLLWEPDFNRSNLTRWCHTGRLVKLRNEHYAFPDCFGEPGFHRYVANRIYMPSYISCHSALSFYGMIPEEVMGITSVTTLKTARFENPLGSFYYHNVKPMIFFGYEPKTTVAGRSVLMATPEKALLDLLYLNPYYITEQDMEELRLDDDYMHNELNMPRLAEQLSHFESKTMEQRVKTLINTYGL